MATTFFEADYGFSWYSAGYVFDESLGWLVTEDGQFLVTEDGEPFVIE